jgi:UMF1 family MFS transporter
VTGRGGIWWRRPVIGWALYDWANSAFSLTVVTAFVPVLLAGYWNDGAPSTTTTFRLGMANGIGSLIVALLAPLLGAVADRSGRRKAALLALTGVGVLSTAALYMVPGGWWLAAAVVYVIASIGFTASNALYDALLVDVAAPGEYDRVSAYGYALGYLGGALLFALNVFTAAQPARFGFESPDQAARFSFLMVAAWWVLFSVPLAAWVREPVNGRRNGPGALVGGFRELIATLGAVRQRRDLFVFLVAYWLYIDGVYTIIKMAVDYGLSLGLTMQDLIQAILITNFVAFPAALAFGRLGELIGARRGIYLGLGIYVAATAGAAFIETATGFYILAFLIGLVQGGVQSLSRSFFARLVPPGRNAEYFGFYNMLGKFAAILGPVLAGVVALVLGSQRIGILSILVLFIAGAWLLTRVREPAAVSDRAG